MRLDASGKVSLDHIYTAPDPRTYFQVLRPLGYCVPQLAKPYFDKLVKEYRETEQVAVPRVLDIGCSYGINAALLKYDATMDELYARYDGSGPGTRAGLLERDRDLSRSRSPAQALRFTGLDASAEALAYAHEAGFLDDTVNADLEAGDPTPAQRDLLAGTDLVISTGCIGYVTERTLTRVVDAQDGRLPGWRTSCCGCSPSTPSRKPWRSWVTGRPGSTGSSSSGGSRARRSGRASWTASPRPMWTRAGWRRKAGSTLSSISPGRSTGRPHHPHSPRREPH